MVSSSIYLSFFHRLILAVADWMFAIIYFHTWCGLSANLRCRSETCCTRLAGNAGRKKVAKNGHLDTIAQLRRAISSQLRHVSTIEKKLVKQQYLLHIRSHNMAHFGPLTTEIGSAVWDTQQISTGFASWLRQCAQRKPTKLWTVVGRLLGWYTIHCVPKIWTTKLMTKSPS